MLTDKDLQKIGEVIDQRLRRELEPIKKSLRKIQKALDITIGYFDRVYLDHEKRIERVENHLGLSKISTN